MSGEERLSFYKLHPNAKVVDDKFDSHDIAFYESDPSQQETEILLEPGYVCSLLPFRHSPSEWFHYGVQEQQEDRHQDPQRSSPALIASQNRRESVHNGLSSLFLTPTRKHPRLLPFAKAIIKQV